MRPLLSQREKAKKKYRKAIQDRVSVKGRCQANQPGRGWRYAIEGDDFVLRANIHGPSQLSASGKSRTIATTCHVYDLDNIGLPGHIVIANFGKRVPKSEHKIDYKTVARLIAKESDDAPVTGICSWKDSRKGPGRGVEEHPAGEASDGGSDKAGT